MQRTLSLIVAAVATYGIYKYSKMSAEQKNNLKVKGREFLDKKMGLGNLFGKKTSSKLIQF